MKNISIQFINDWIQFVPNKNIKWNWIIFTFFKFELEKEEWLGQFDIDFVLLGLGIHIGICYKETEELKELEKLANSIEPKKNKKSTKK